MFDGKKEAMDLAIEVDVDLNIAMKEAAIMLLHPSTQEEKRSLERLIDAIERSKDDVRRSML